MSKALLICIIASVHLFPKTEGSPASLQNQAEATSTYATCEKTYSVGNFSIILPKKETPETFECRFLVTAYTPDVCRMRLNFKKFVVASSPSCREQFLRIGGRRWCGSVFGTQFVPLPDSSILIQYRGNGEHPLEIEVEQVRCKVLAGYNGCDVISSDPKTEISSPNYPNAYPTPVSCLYTVLSRPFETCQLFVKFHDFEIPDSPGCLRGRLLIDRKAYCGNKTGWTVAVNASDYFRFEFSAGSGQVSGGFRISVEKVLCGVPAIAGNSSASQVTSLSPFPPVCCNKIFNSQSFILASPGFLELDKPSDFECAYQIVQVTPTTCRLRLNFLHFWLGQEDVYYGCTDGFLEIDGRRICGCKDGVTIYSYFNSGRKDLWLNMRSLRGKGFLIEVQQEECSRGPWGRSLPEDMTIIPDNEVEVFSTNTTVEKVTSRFLVPTDDSRCNQWGLDKARDVLQSLSYQCPVSPVFTQPSLPTNPIIPPNFLTNIPLPIPPIFPPPFPPAYPRPQPPIINPSPPVYPPSPQPPVIPPPINPRPPVYPPQPPIIPPPIIPRPPVYPPPQPPILPEPTCPSLPQNPISPPQFPTWPRPPPQQGRCLLFSSLQGGFQSPGYPWSYPPNQNCCYRFRQAPGFCRLQLTILDFDLAWSPKCWKDYLVLDQGGRYCGGALQSSVSYLPFRNGVASVNFVSDSFVSRRGFRAVFRQAPCFSSPYLPHSDTFPSQSFPKPPLKTPVTPSPNYDDGFELNVTPVR